MKNLIKQIITATFIFILPLAGHSAETYILTSAPRESVEDGKKQYEPIAEFLTQATGQTFIYEHPGDWLSYSKKMRDDHYDVVLDGPHFISWRIVMLNHTPIVRLDGSLQFLLLVNKDSAIKSLNELTGYPICSLAAPNMATLSVQKLFNNPMQQPILKEAKNFKSAFNDMRDGKCQASILPVGIYNRMNKDGSIDKSTKIIYRSSPMAQQGISVSQQISPDLRNQISNALLSENGQLATRLVRKRFGGNKNMLATNAKESQGYFHLLSDYWGFDVPQNKLKALAVAEVASLETTALQAAALEAAILEAKALQASDIDNKPVTSVIAAQ
ncbi:MAG: PhnD/SsuA/transferrin family substrate-binding protein [Gammaproteobacteria bacterium]|nr:PhnD/SsuA/transferrin family substrate-binding protein [Gammaproteobacteria bacterium]